MLRLNYDARGDILYLGWADKSNSVGDEILSGYVIHTDMDTDEVTGLTVLDFMERYRSGRFNPPPLPIYIDYEVEVIPLATAHIREAVTA